MNCDGIIDQMVAYFMTATWQSRINLQTDDRLMAVALSRATDMAENDYFSHVTIDGVWPNQQVVDAGYVLPDWYDLRANYVESIASGFGSAVRALDALAASLKHMDYMIGNGFWKDHMRYGMGFGWVDDRRIYVVLTAPVEETAQPADSYTIYLPHVTQPRQIVESRNA